MEEARIEKPGLTHPASGREVFGSDQLPSSYAEVTGQDELEIKEQNGPFGHYSWTCPNCDEVFQGGGRDALEGRARTHLAEVHHVQDRKTRTKDHRAALRAMNAANDAFYYPKRKDSQCHRKS